MPDTMPEETATVATAALLLVQVPPAVASASAVVEPAQTDRAPEMAAGAPLMVTMVVRTHPGVLV
jgi:hypothetical protein